MGICFSSEKDQHSNYTHASPQGDDSVVSQTPSRTSSNTTPLASKNVKDLRQSPGYINVSIFTYDEMSLATKRFRPDLILGEGGFGVVYKGVIDDTVRAGYKTTQVAIKELNREGYQGDREWLAEVNYLGQLSNPNLVKLIGYCCEDDHRLLVYEYMASGSLEKHLFRRVGCTLTWSRRMKIALDAAKGLAFLHGAERPIIYRDFKTSNILLDGDFNAKLSDFGLAKEGPMGDQTHVSTRVMGTYGYAAPEYVMTGHLTARSDVYGFGVVLLELLLGRRAMDKSRPGQEHNLVEWARPLLNHNKKLLRIVDPRLEGQYSLKTAMKVAHLAYQCLSQNPKGRPLMSQVVELLESLQTTGNHEVQSGEGGVTLYEAPKGTFGTTPMKRDPNRRDGERGGEAHRRSKPGNGGSKSEQVTNRDRRLHQIMFADRDYERVERAELWRVEDKGSKPHVTALDCSQKDYTVITMRSKDRPKLLFDIICTLTDMQYVVFHGMVNTGRTEAYQEFYIRHVDGLPINSEAERERVVQCLEAAIERRASEGLELQLCTDDRVGLLSDITRIFRENSLRVTRAEISTKSGKAIDTFYVTDVTGSPVDPKIIDSVRRQIGQTILQVKCNSSPAPKPPQGTTMGYLFGNLFKARSFQPLKLVRSYS